MSEEKIIQITACAYKYYVYDQENMESMEGMKILALTDKGRIFLKDSAYRNDEWELYDEGKLPIEKASDE